MGRELSLEWSTTVISQFTEAPTYTSLLLDWVSVCVTNAMKQMAKFLKFLAYNLIDEKGKETIHIMREIINIKRAAL